MEVADNFRRAAEAGSSLSDIAAAFGFKGTTMVSRFCRLHQLKEEIRHLVDWGESVDASIGFSVAVEIAQFDSKQHVEISERILEFNLNKKEAKSIRQLVERSGKPLATCVSEVVARRSITTIRHVILGNIEDHRLSKHLRNQSQNARDGLLRNCINELYPGIGDFTAKLGHERFAVIGGKSIAKMAADHDFERNVAEALFNRCSSNGR